MQLCTNKWASICILIFITHLGASQNSSSLPLKSWIDKIEQSSSLVFNYDPSILSSQEIVVPGNIKSPKAILDYIDQVTKFQFKIIDNKYVLIHTADEKPLYNFLKVRCQIHDANSNEPLIYANIFTEDYSCGSTSNEDGSFTLKGHLNPQQHIIISYLGYEETRVHLSEITSGRIKKIGLKPINHHLTDVVITETRKPFLGESMEQVSTIRPVNLPMLAGQAEKDPLALVQMLPGISSIGESISNISIRGSTSDQNLVTWNQIPLYHTGHFVGLLSSCNPFVVDEIKVFNDGFKSNYGGRIAGVIEMNSKNTHFQKPSLAANINLLTSNIHVGLPMWKDRISLEASYRTSYGDVFENAIYKSFFNQSFQLGRISNIKSFINDNNLQSEVFNTSKVDFFDYNLRILMTPTDRDRIEINYIKAQDIVSNSLTFDWSEKHETDTIRISNFGVSGIWSHRFTDKWSSTFSYVYSGFENRYSYIDDITGTMSSNLTQKSNGVKESKLSWDNVLNFGETKLEFGIIRNQILNQNYQISIPVNVYEPNEDTSQIGSLNGVYVNYHYRISEKFNIDAGARYSYYNLTGAYFTEPRITFWNQLNNHWRFKASAGKYTQVLTQIEEYNDVQVEDMYWRIADGKEGNELIPITSNVQFSAGVSFMKQDWKVDLTLFTKNVENITALGLEFDTGLNPWWIATGESKGVEFHVSKKWRKGQSMLNYSFNDMIMDFGGDRIYPAPYNHRHHVAFMQTYQISRLELSLICKIKSGRPYSEYASFFVGPPNEFGDPEPTFVYEKRFDKYLDFYQRFDLSAAYHLVKRVRYKWSAKAGISILNLFNRKNIILKTNYVDYSKWPEINPATFDRVGLGFTPNIFLHFQF